MKNILFSLILLLLVAVAGCANASDQAENITQEQNFEFTGTIVEFREYKALVETDHDAFSGNSYTEDEPQKMNIIVDLSVNREDSYQLGDKIKMIGGEEILESDPPQIETISVELID